MYTEIIKIIEGGLVNDKEKVVNYATTLADNLEVQGENSLAKKIKATLSKKRGTLTSLDSFSTKPVDTESRMDIVEIAMPQIDSQQVVLSKYSQDAISSFIKSYEYRDTLLKSGLDVSNSLLLYGPPGCGKTTVAQLISSMTGLPLVTARLDSLVSSLLGSTAKNIRKIFDYVSKKECILFLDEFDVIAKLRNDKNELGELKRVVNSLIQNIDSFNDDSILIAATNHHELLDPAVWRRFATIITLEKPQKEEIRLLLHVLLDDKITNFLLTARKLDYIEDALVGLSHSDIKTIIFNAMRGVILSDRTCLTNCDVLKEVFFHKNHAIKNESEFIGYLLEHGATHKEVNESLDIPLRRIQGISKSVDKEEL
ncbi:MAG: ATP-binding protein [Clostridiales Family XIII bacterium]|jgi:SpoVK/Ycf46/Vps4 family AAA+-type ATPase|nr:ATP-binding protein [Clostridiales Family XIII bacterium]